MEATYTDDISYEFNTDGFYNILSDQLYQNSDILQRICESATQRLEVKRKEHKALSLSKGAECGNNDKQIKQKKVDLSNLQMVKVKKTQKNNEEEKDWSKHQLSNLYVKENANEILQNKNQAKISPLDSFVNTDFFAEQEEANKNEVDLEMKVNEQKEESKAKNAVSAKTEFMTQITGDEVVDSLLMKLSSHMTI